MNRRDWRQDPDAPTGAAAAYAVVVTLLAGVALLIALVVLSYQAAR